MTDVVVMGTSTVTADSDALFDDCHEDFLSYWCLRDRRDSAFFGFRLGDRGRLDYLFGLYDGLDFLDCHRCSFFDNLGGSVGDRIGRGCRDNNKVPTVRDSLIDNYGMLC